MILFIHPAPILFPYALFSNQITDHKSQLMSNQSFEQDKHETVKILPPNPNGGGGKPAGIPDPGIPPGVNEGIPGIACPSAAYEFVIVSITFCAFSCPISIFHQIQVPNQ